MTVARIGGLITLGVVIVAGLVVGGVFLARNLGTESQQQTTLRVALLSFGDEVLDPYDDFQAGWRYYGPMFDHLLGEASDGTLALEWGVLEKWDASPDAATYTLNLKQGLMWHSGAEITSDDVKFSLQNHLRTAVACGACGTLRGNIERVDVIDRYSLSVRLKQPDVGFIAKLGISEEDVTLLPARDGLAELFANAPFGSGPWMYANRSPGEFIVYEANPDYWNAERLPGFKQLRLIQAPERDTRLAMLRTGTVDMAPIEPRDIEQLKAEGFAIEGPQNVIDMTLRFFMSYDPEYLTSKLDFRKALILGMDVPSIIERVYPPEAATPATGSAMFGPLAEGYDPSLPSYPYDPAQARRLLDEMGYDGEAVQMLSIAVYSQSETTLVNQIIAEGWRDIGLNVKIIPTSYLPVKARFLPRPQQFEDAFPAPVFQGGHTTIPGGILNAFERYLSSSSRSLLSYYDPERGDSLLADLTSMTDLEARRQKLKQLNRELYDEYWAAPIVWRHEIYALREGLTGWRPADGTFNDLHLETVRPVP